MEACPGHLWPPRLGTQCRCGAGQQMVRNGSGGPCHQDLGFGVGRAQVVVDGPHLDGARVGGVVEAPVSIFVRRGQGEFALFHSYQAFSEPVRRTDGKVLGFGGEQSHPALPRTSIRRVCVELASDAGHPRHLWARCIGTCVGHADKGANPRPLRAYGDRRGRAVPGVGSAGHHRKYGLDSPVRALSHYPQSYPS